MAVAAVVLAAGRGVRMGGPVPKQYADLAGRPALLHAIETFLRHPGVERVQPVIAPADRETYRRTVADLDTPALLPAVTGGTSRQESSLAGLRALAASPPEHVLIHDAARPFVGEDTISRVVDALGRHAGAIPAIGVPDLVWSVDPGRRCRRPMQRDSLCRAQTPQGFHFPSILAAHAAAEGEACQDDASVATRFGIDVVCVAGDTRNFKLTTREDLAEARRRLHGGRETRMGQGLDVHAFGDGTGARLCGVRIPDCRSLLGHSDADVGLHALTDAIYGAAAAGDLGAHFPPDDPQWRDCDSAVFLRHAVELAGQRGLSPVAIDITLVCEVPRIAPYRDQMRERVAELLQLAPERVSIKATTTERLGFLGRGEGIAALALATMQSGA